MSVKQAQRNLRDDLKDAVDATLAKEEAARAAAAAALVKQPHDLEREQKRAERKQREEQDEAENAAKMEAKRAEKHARREDLARRNAPTFFRYDEDDQLIHLRRIGRRSSKSILYEVDQRYGRCGVVVFEAADDDDSMLASVDEIVFDTADKDNDPVDASVATRSPPRLLFRCTMTVKNSQQGQSLLWTTIVYFTMKCRQGDKLSLSFLCLE